MGTRVPPRREMRDPESANKRGGRSVSRTRAAAPAVPISNRKMPPFTAPGSKIIFLGAYVVTFKMGAGNFLHRPRGREQARRAQRPGFGLRLLMLAMRKGVFVRADRLKEVRMICPPPLRGFRRSQPYLTACFSIPHS